MILGLVIVGIVVVMVWICCRTRSRHRRRRAMRIPDTDRIRSRKKPAWVVNEVIRLKAMMPREGFRTIAAAFNARNAHRGVSVGKTFVAQTLKRKGAEVLRLRRQIRNRKRFRAQRNRVWGMDLTFASDGRQASPMLGIVDHGTRRLVCLKRLSDRTSIGVLRLLLDSLEKMGKPRFLRTDNEALFNSRVFRFGLWFLGIRKQTTDPFCPWQNGRIERLFRTLKERLYPWWQAVGVPEDIQVDLNTFQYWYNHARPHQSLSGITPAMAWSDQTTYTKPPKFFEAWDGILTGWIPPP